MHDSDSKGSLLKKFFWLTLKVIVSAGIIYFTVYQLEWSALYRLWLEMNTGWILLSVAIMTASYFAGAYQWLRILKISQFHIPYSRVLGYYYVGLFFNNFLISGMGGDFLRVYDIHQHSENKDSLSPALATVFFDRLIGFITLIFLATLSGLFEIGHGASVKMILLILSLLLSWVFLMIALFNKSVAEWSIKPLGKLLPDKMYSRFQHLYYEINRFGIARKELFYIFIISLAVQTQRILAIWAIGRALGDASQLIYYVIFVPLIAVVASLPISIGGTGPREQTSVILFRRIGVSQEIAFSIGILTYFVSMVTTLPGALIFIMRKGKNRHA
jgi:glycosyltransferase 2 family protein